MLLAPASAACCPVRCLPPTLTCLLPAPAEHAEHVLCPPQVGKGKPTREAKWQAILEQHPSLKACILEANPSWEAESIPHR